MSGGGAPFDVAAAAAAAGVELPGSVDADERALSIAEPVARVPPSACVWNDVWALLAQAFAVGAAAAENRLSIPLKRIVYRL